MLTEFGFAEELDVNGILLESVPGNEFDCHFDLAIHSEAMRGMEKDLESYSIAIEAKRCPADVYAITDFSNKTFGVKVDFEVQTSCKDSKLSKWWEQKQKPILDIRMYFPEASSQPLGIAYLRAGEIVIIEYEFAINCRPLVNAFCPGGKEGYIDKSDISDFFELLPKG